MPQEKGNGTCASEGASKKCLTDAAVEEDGTHGGASGEEDAT